MRARQRHARAELLLGQARVHLAQGRVSEAANTLQQALDELDGREPPRGDLTGQLTPSELRIARMAADGMKNREIAQALFVSVKAVEYHLANTYRKLGIAGRRELEARLVS